MNQRITGFVNQFVQVAWSEPGRTFQIDPWQLTAVIWLWSENVEMKLIAGNGDADVT